MGCASCVPIILQAMQKQVAFLRTEMGFGGSGLLWLVLLQLITGILGWGEEGHYATCKIAEGYLTEEAAAAVRELLPGSAEGDLAAVCSWPDEIRHLYPWSSALHFADTPDLKCSYEFCRDCLDTKNEADCSDSAKPKGRCVTGAIYNYTNQLVDAYQNSESSSNYNLTEALIFLSHFIGDVHQPLHEGFLGDLGGNRIKLQWYQIMTNLHRVWDDMIIGSAVKTYYDNDLAVMIQSIQKKITDGWYDQQTSWGSCDNNQTACPDSYASESISLACSYGYKNATQGSTLGDYYFLTRLPVVEKRLAQGGIRLAATLNRIFAPQLRIAQFSS